MSSVNKKYTFSYSQPEEYHFSHDSVFLAQFVFDWLMQNNDQRISTVADVCSGCGIIGMDLLVHLSKAQFNMPGAIDFIEVQDIYKAHFDKNAISLNEHIKKDVSLNYVDKNYANLILDPDYFKKYDLIVCNPPYFKSGQGRLSPSPFKNRCRFYIDSDFESLIKFISYSLVPSGQAFILIHSLQDHNDSYDIQSLVRDLKMSALKVGEIRGTDVFRIRAV